MLSAISAKLKRWQLRKEIEKIRKKTVGDIMTRYVVSVEPQETVIRAATKMIAEDISCLVVMKNDSLKGILSERDFMHKVPLDKKVFGMKVQDIMTPNVVTVEPTMLLTDAVALMKERNFRRLVVADKDKLLGIVTQTDFSFALRELFSVFPVNDNLTLSRIMSKKVLKVTPKESFKKAREKMKKINVGSILIMDKDVPLGIFTEYDVTMQFYDQEGTLSIRGLSDFMRKYVRATSKDMNLIEANHLLLHKKMRRLPVVDEKKLVGIVTQTDIIRFCFTNLDELAAACEEAKFEKAKDHYKGEFVTDHLKVY